MRPTAVPRLRKLALTAHVLTSVGWLGAAACFLALAITGVTSDEALGVRSAYIGMDLVMRHVVVPSAIATVVTGVVQSLATPWGLFRHWWVVVKLVVTVVATAVLLLQVAPTADLAATADEAVLGPTDLGAARSSLVVHSGAGLVVLLLPLSLSVYKPRGLTGYGRRRASVGPPMASP